MSASLSSVRRLLVGAATVLALSSAARADPPRVVSSEPADGAKDVPVDVGVLRIVFDRPMKRNQWTLEVSDRGTFPPLAAPDDSPWRDATTVELKLEPLEPATSYAVQLNAAAKRRLGFRSDEGAEALTDTTITFTTRKGAAGPVPAPVALVGRWVDDPDEAKRNLRFDLLEDGTCVLRSGREGKEKRGRWTRTGDELELKTAELAQRFKLRSAGPDEIELEDRRGVAIRLLREGGRASAAVPVDVSRDPLVGTWWDDERAWNREIEIRLERDGRFRILRKDGDQKGTWSHPGEELRMKPDGTPAVMRWGLKVVGPDEIELRRPDGRTEWRLYRQGGRAPAVDPSAPAPGAEPKHPLVGLWKGEDEYGFVRSIRFDRDGGVVLESTVFDEVERREGSYAVKDAEHVEVISDETGKSTVFRIRFEDAKTLVLVGRNGTEDRYTRDGAEAVAPRPEPAPLPPPSPQPRPAPLPAPEPARLALVGTWRITDSDVAYEIVLEADGTFARTVGSADGAPQRSTGTWAARDGVLALTEADGTRSETRFTLRGNDLLRLTFGAGLKMSLGRVPPDPGPTPAPRPAPVPPPTPPARAPTLVGVWHLREAGAVVRVEFLPDGTYRRDLRATDRAESVRGTWAARGDGLEIRAGSDERPLTLEFSLVDADTLELRDPTGHSVRMRRGEPPPDGE